MRLANIKIRILWSDRQDGNGDNHRDICKMMSGSGGNSVFFALWKYLAVEVSDKGLEMFKMFIEENEEGKKKKPDQ